MESDGTDLSDGAGNESVAPGPKVTRVMLDLETLGTRPGSIFFAIGAVVFSETLGMSGLGAEYYQLTDPVDAQREGLTLDEETRAWWLEQGEEARAELNQAIERGLPLRMALYEFQGWLDKVRDGGDLEVWAKGPSFDCALLKAAVARLGLTREIPLWHHSRERCVRTVMETGDTWGVKESAKPHHALEDAKAQAVTVMDCWWGLRQMVWDSGSDGEDIGRAEARGDISDRDDRIRALEAQLAEKTKRLAECEDACKDLMLTISGRKAAAESPAAPVVEAQPEGTDDL